MFCCRHSCVDHYAIGFHIVSVLYMYVVTAKLFYLLFEIVYSSYLNMLNMFIRHILANTYYSLNFTINVLNSFTMKLKFSSIKYMYYYAKLSFIFILKYDWNKTIFM